MKLLASAGGTGGHIFPAISVIDERRRNKCLTDVLFVGRREGMERETARLAGLDYRAVTTAPWPTGISARAFISAARNAAGLAECLGIIRGFKPDVVFTTGGYVSLPAAMAAGMSRTPLVIHEQNRQPGRANRLAARFASRIAVSTPEVPIGFPPDRTVYVGTPVRRDLIDSLPDKPSARARFNLDPDTFTLLAFGGSQGAESINRALLSATDYLDPQMLQILVATGPSGFDEVSAAFASVPIRAVVKPFIDDMAAALVAADLALCRSGASTLAELAVVGLPAVLVPYPHAVGGHQQYNAELFRQVGAAEIIADSELSGKRLADAVAAIALDSAAISRMSASAASLARPDAADRIAGIIRELAESSE